MWSYWILCTVISVLVGFTADATAKSRHCSFAFELIIIAIFICIPFYDIPIANKRSSKTNIFGTVYYDKISDVVITKEK